MYAAYAARDVGTAVAVGGVGLVMTVGAIAGIIALARALSRTKNTGTIVAAVIGIVALGIFALAGLAVTGCGFILGA
jgi:hypothetical protein